MAALPGRQEPPSTVQDFVLALHDAQRDFALAHVSAQSAELCLADQIRTLHKIHARMLDLRTVRALAKDGKFQEAYTFLVQLPNL